MKQWSFEKFSGRIPRGDTKIGINRSGLIRLGVMFCKKTGVKKYTYCLQYFDKINNALALKFTNKKEDGIVTVTTDGEAAALSSKSFFKANNLDLDKISGRYEWTKENIPGVGDVFIVELSKNEKIS
jgi:hypothetical protein